MKSYLYVGTYYIDDQEMLNVFIDLLNCISSAAHQMSAPPGAGNKLNKNNQLLAAIYLVDKRAMLSGRNTNMEMTFILFPLQHR